MSYRTTKLADEDIIDCYARGVRDFGTPQVERYLAGLIECFDLLAERPSLARERSEFSPPVRVHFYQAHVIPYLIVADGILIIRVLGGRQDWAHILQAR